MSDEMKELIRLARQWVEAKSFPAVASARVDFSRALQRIQPEELAHGLVFLGNALGVEAQNAQRRSY